MILSMWYYSHIISYITCVIHLICSIHGTWSVDLSYTFLLTSALYTTWYYSHMLFFVLHKVLFISQVPFPLFIPCSFEALFILYVTFMWLLQLVHVTLTIQLGHAAVHLTHLTHFTCAICLIGVIYMIRAVHRFIERVLFFWRICYPSN